MMRILILLFGLALAASAATQGRGRAPIKSTWVRTTSAIASQWRLCNLRRPIKYGYTNQDGTTWLNEWFFDAAVAPPASGLLTRTLTGAGK